MMDADRSKTSRLTLVGLFLLFAAPLAAAFWLYYATDWRPSRTTNHGTLIEPVRALPALSFADPLAQPAVSRLFTGKWSLVVVANGRCDEACRTSLVYARQVHIGMGRLGTRMQRVFLVPADCCDREYLDREQAGLRVADLGGGDAALGAGRNELLAAFGGERVDQQIFIVDPLGNLMMSYDTRLAPRGLHDDLQKLLDLSHIG
jgi:hypothetical protein